jgi:hypothetical protein
MYWLNMAGHHVYIPWGADLSYTPMLLRESITRTPLGGTSNWDSAVPMRYLNKPLFQFSIRLLPVVLYSILSSCQNADTQIII